MLELVEIASQPLPNQTLVPDGCQARFVARIMPGESDRAFLERITRSLDGLAGISVALDRLRQPCYTGAMLETVDFLPGWRCAEDDPWRQQVLDALAAAGLPADCYAAPCGTNASESAGRRGITSFVYGPGSLAEAHISDEWVDIDELLAAQAGFSAIAHVIMCRAQPGYDDALLKSCE